MMAFLRFLLTLPLILALIVFAVANRQDISFIWSPFHQAYETPLYVLALGMMAAGFLIGAIFAWASMGHIRRDRRKQRKTIQNLEKRLESANENLAPPTTIEQKETHGS